MHRLIAELQHVSAASAPLPTFSTPLPRWRRRGWTRLCGWVRRRHCLPNVDVVEWSVESVEHTLCSAHFVFCGIGRCEHSSHLEHVRSGGGPRPGTSRITNEVHHVTNKRDRQMLEESVIGLNVLFPRLRCQGSPREDLKDASRLYAAVANELKCRECRPSIAYHAIPLHTQRAVICQNLAHRTSRIKCKVQMHYITVIARSLETLSLTRRIP